jgi:hypothetical protein
MFYFSNFKMKKLITTDLNGFGAWAKLFEADEPVVVFEDVDIQIQFFANGDATWMLVSRYLSDTSAIDYAFMPVEDKDSPHARALTLAFLKTVDYSLPKLLAWLESAAFIETDIAEEISVGKIRITRNHARATEPNTRPLSDVNPPTFEEYDDEKNPG